MERRRLASWGTIGAGGAIVLASLGGPVAAMPPTPAPTPVAAYDACADANGDGELGVTDGVQALRAAAGLTSSCTRYRCDVDGSGDVTVTDGVGVLERAAAIPAPQFYECPVPSRRRSFAGFRNFRLWREREIFGFCAPVGGVLSAEVAQESGGTYVVRLARAGLRPLGDPACLYPMLSSADGACIAPEPVAERVLSAEEAADLRDRFGAIEVFEARAPICRVVAFDPCISNAVAWDGFETRQDSCRAPWVSGDDFGRIVDLLEALAPTP